MRGRFISFEGGEGAGKSTQARMLADALRDRGFDVLLTREPGGTAGAEAIRSLLLDRFDPGWGPTAEALLFAAARADHVARVIQPALASGTWVICDRYLDSSRAYQGGNEALSDAKVLTLHEIGSDGLLPDRTLLLETHADIAEARVAIRDGHNRDRIGSRNAVYHEGVARRFREMAEAEPARFVRIAAHGDADCVHRAVLGAIEDLLGAAP